MGFIARERPLPARDRGPRRPSPAAPWSNERGAINFFVLFLLAVAGAALYFGAAYAPHWMRNREVISAMREAGYQAWRQGDDVLLNMVLDRTDRIVLVDDGEDEPYPAIDETMVVIRRDSKNVYIELSYEVPMRFPWSSKYKDLRFENRIHTDLEVPTR